ncbi:uncharacterized protein [Diadema antillarum]|uniref:uncharacterized protein n=1 Tax=Diadema antillarum TaxID=105358 RepID=UPI003A88F1E9
MESSGDKPEGLSQVSADPNVRLTRSFEEEEEEDAWMRDSTLSLEDEEEEERDRLMPFGLNQSWPRASAASLQPKSAPVPRERKLLRQISQESLDESTNLLIDHVVMLPDLPKAQAVQPHLILSSLPLEGDDCIGEEEEGEGEEKTHAAVFKPVMEARSVVADDNGNNASDEVKHGAEAKTQVTDSSQHHILQNSEEIDPRLSHSHSSEYDTTEENSCKAIEQSIDSIALAEGEEFQDAKTTENTSSVKSLPLEAWISKDQESHSAAKIDAETEDVSSERATFESLNSMQPAEENLQEETNSGVYQSHHDHIIIDTPKEIPQDLGLLGRSEQTVIDDPAGVKKKYPPTVRKKPPLLRKVSQESIEESTNLLLDHIVVMDLHQEQEMMDEDDEDAQRRCPFLVDIKETPLLRDDDDGGLEEELEERFIYRGEVDSCDEEEEGTWECLPSSDLTKVTTASIISDQAASTLQEIDLIRVDLDDAIRDFQNLKHEFPDRCADFEGMQFLKDQECVRDGFTDILQDDQDSESDESACCFSRIPEEIVLHIFKYLSRTELCTSVAPVCKAWHHLALDPLLWQHLDFSSRTSIHPEVMRAVLRRCPLLQSVTFHGRDEVSASEIQALVEYCPGVREIDLGFVSSVHDAMFSTLISGCPMLTSINVEGCDQITDSLISRLILLPRLKTLNLSHCTKLTDEAVFEIAKFFDHLEELDINGIPWITDRAVEMLTQERQATLRCLRLDGAELTDVSVHQAMQCPNLSEFEVFFCEQLTDDTLQSLRDWGNPVHLLFHKGKEFTESALASLFLSPHLSGLTFLDLSECSELKDQGLINIAHRCPYLKHLAVEWCWFITDVGLVEVLDNCRYLEHLDLLGLHAILGHCLADIPTKLPQLTYLDLRQCNRITDAMLVKMVHDKPDLLIVNYYGEEVTHDNIPSTLVL